jgi:hypothetical protein
MVVGAAVASERQIRSATQVCVSQTRNWRTSPLGAPIATGFGREDTTVESSIRPILDRLYSDSRLGLRVTQDGGLSNYFAFLVYDASLGRPPVGEARGVPCVVVQLSLMAPIGVYGCSTFSEGERFLGWSNLGPEQVCDPACPPDWLAAAVVAAVHEASPYRLVERGVTDQPLPPGVVIYEYCLCAKPWDRVFHALFSDTD